MALWFVFIVNRSVILFLILSKRKIFVWYLTAHEICFPELLRRYRLG